MKRIFEWFKRLWYRIFPKKKAEAEIREFIEEGEPEWEMVSQQKLNGFLVITIRDKKSMRTHVQVLKN